MAREEVEVVVEELVEYIAPQWTRLPSIVTWIKSWTRHDKSISKRRRGRSLSYNEGWKVKSGNHIQLQEYWSIQFALELPIKDGDICQTITYTKEPPSQTKNSAIEIGVSVEVKLDDDENGQTVCIRGVVTDTCCGKCRVRIDKNRERWYDISQVSVREGRAVPDQGRACSACRLEALRDQTVCFRDSHNRNVHETFEVGRVLSSDSSASPLVRVEWSIGSISCCDVNDLTRVQAHQVVSSLVCIQNGFLGSRLNGVFYPALPGLQLDLLSEGSHIVNVMIKRGRLYFTVDGFNVGISRYPGPFAVHAFGNIFQATHRTMKKYRPNGICSVCGNFCGSWKMRMCRCLTRSLPSPKSSWNFSDVHVYSCQSRLVTSFTSSSKSLLSLVQSISEGFWNYRDIWTGSLAEFEEMPMEHRKVIIYTMLHILMYCAGEVDSTQWNLITSIGALDIDMLVDFQHVNASFGAHLILLALESSFELFQRVCSSFPKKMNWNETISPPGGSIALLLLQRCLWWQNNASGLEFSTSGDAELNQDLESMRDELVPSEWKEGEEYMFDSSARFSVGEICLVKRSDGTLRFGKVAKERLAVDKIFSDVARYDILVNGGIATRERQTPGQEIAKIVIKQKKSNVSAMANGLAQKLLDFFRINSVRLQPLTVHDTVDCLLKLESKGLHVAAEFLKLLDVSNASGSELSPLVTWGITKILNPHQDDGMFDWIKKNLLGCFNVHLDDDLDKIIMKIRTSRRENFLGLDFDAPYPKFGDNLHDFNCGQMLLHALMNSCQDYTYDERTLNASTRTSSICIRSKHLVCEGQTYKEIRVLQPFPPPDDVIKFSHPWVHVGWSRPNFSPRVRSNRRRRKMYEAAFMYCGSKGVKYWSKTKESYGEKRIKQGDVIGCLLDCDAREIKYFINGEEQGVAFKEEITEEAVREGLYFTCTLGPGQGVEVVSDPSDLNAPLFDVFQSEWIRLRRNSRNFDLIKDCLRELDMASHLNFLAPFHGRISFSTLEGIPLVFICKGSVLQCQFNGHQLNETLSSLSFTDFSFYDLICVDGKHKFKVCRSRFDRSLLENICIALDVRMEGISCSKIVESLCHGTLVLKAMKDTYFGATQDVLDIFRLIGSKRLTKSGLDDFAEQFLSCSTEVFGSNHLIRFILISNLIEGASECEQLVGCLLVDLLAVLLQIQAGPPDELAALREEMSSSSSIDMTNPDEIVIKLKSLKIDWNAICLQHEDKAAFLTVGNKLLSVLNTPQSIYSLDGKFLWNNVSRAFPCLIWRSNIACTSGRSFYQVQVLADPPDTQSCKKVSPWLNVGWSRKNNKFSAHVRMRRRMSQAAFMYCGSKGVKYWNESKRSYGEKRIKQGDVIGCLLDCDAREIKYFINGEEQGVAFKEEITEEAVREGLYFTCTLGPGQGIKLLGGEFNSLQETESLSQLISSDMNRDKDYGCWSVFDRVLHKWMPVRGSFADEVFLDLAVAVLQSCDREMTVLEDENTDESFPDSGDLVQVKSEILDGSYRSFASLPSGSIATVNSKATQQGKVASKVSSLKVSFGSEEGRVFRSELYHVEAEPALRVIDLKRQTSSLIFSRFKAHGFNYKTYAFLLAKFGYVQQDSEMISTLLCNFLKAEFREKDESFDEESSIAFQQSGHQVLNILYIIKARMHQCWEVKDSCNHQMLKLLELMRIKIDVSRLVTVFQLIEEVFKLRDICSQSFQAQDGEYIGVYTFAFDELLRVADRLRRNPSEDTLLSQALFPLSIQILGEEGADIIKDLDDVDCNAWVDILMTAKIVLQTASMHSPAPFERNYSIQMLERAKCVQDDDLLFSAMLLLFNSFASLQQEILSHLVFLSLSKDSDSLKSHLYLFLNQISKCQFPNNSHQTNNALLLEQAFLAGMDVQTPVRTPQINSSASPSFALGMVEKLLCFQSELIRYNGQIHNKNAERMLIVKSNEKISSGRFFFEVKVLQPPPPPDGVIKFSHPWVHVGWSRPNFSPRVRSNRRRRKMYEAAFMYCGSKGVKYWNESKRSYGEKRIKQGDVIGCLLDCDAREIKYFINGEEQGVAFKEEITEEAVREGLYFTCTLGPGQEIKVVSDPSDLNSSQEIGEQTLDISADAMEVSFAKSAGHASLLDRTILPNDGTQNMSFMYPESDDSAWNLVFTFSDSHVQLVLLILSRFVQSSATMLKISAKSGMKGKISSAEQHDQEKGSSIATPGVDLAYIKYEISLIIHNLIYSDVFELHQFSSFCSELFAKLEDVSCREEMVDMVIEILEHCLNIYTLSHSITSQTQKDPCSKCNVYTRSMCDLCQMCYTCCSGLFCPQGCWTQLNKKQELILEGVMKLNVVQSDRGILGRVVERATYFFLLSHHTAHSTLLQACSIPDAKRHPTNFPEFLIEIASQPELLNQVYSYQHGPKVSHFTLGHQLLRILWKRSRIINRSTQTFLCRQVANVKISSGRFFVEVKVLQPPPPPDDVIKFSHPWVHVGWSRPNFSPRVRSNQNRRRMYEAAFMYCGSKGVKYWSKTKESYGEKRIKQGDVIGCLLDCDAREIKYFINGEEQGVAFKEEITEEAVREGLYFTCTLGPGQAVEFLMIRGDEMGDEIYYSLNSIAAPSICVFNQVENEMLDSFSSMLENLNLEFEDKSGRGEICLRELLSGVEVFFSYANCSQFKPKVFNVFDTLFLRISRSITLGADEDLYEAYGSSYSAINFFGSILYDALPLSTSSALREKFEIISLLLSKSGFCEVMKLVNMKIQEHSEQAREKSQTMKDVLGIDSLMETMIALKLDFTLRLPSRCHHRLLATDIVGIAAQNHNICKIGNVCKAFCESKSLTMRLQDRMTSGRFFFEVKVLQPPPPPDDVIKFSHPWVHVGWSRPNFSPRVRSNRRRRKMYEAAFMYCGSKGVKYWSKTKESYGEKRIKQGDVIGCLLDCDAREIKYFINGEEQGVAFKEEITEEAVREGLYFTCTLGPGQGVELHTELSKPSISYPCSLPGPHRSMRLKVFSDKDSWLLADSIEFDVVKLISSIHQEAGSCSSLDIFKAYLGFLLCEENVGLETKRIIKRFVSDSNDALQSPSVNEFFDLKSQQIQGSEQSLTTIPVYWLYVWHGSKITELNLDRNLLSVIPCELSALPLVNLDVSQNRLSSLPSAICYISTLKTLRCSRNLLKVLPHEIGLLQSLVELHAAENAIYFLPRSLYDLTRLEVLDVGGPCLPCDYLAKGQLTLNQEAFINFFVEYPSWQNLLPPPEQKELFEEFCHGKEEIGIDELGPLQSRLMELFWRMKGREEELFDFDPAIFSMRSLSRVNLRNISIRGSLFTSSTYKAQMLRVVDLSNNEIVGLGNCLNSLEGIKELLLEGNPLRIPQEIRARGRTATINFLRGMAERSKESFKMMLFLHGYGGVGKSSLLAALRNESFDASCAMTDGIDIKTLKIPIDHQLIRYLKRSLTEEEKSRILNRLSRVSMENLFGVEIEFVVYDFAGQEVYYNSHQLFLHNRALDLVLWNVRGGISNSGLAFWLSNIKTCAPKAPILVIGTKIDEVEPPQLDTVALVAKFPQIKGFHAVSSKSKVGIDELKMMIVKYALLEDYMGQKVPYKWSILEQTIRSETSALQEGYVRFGTLLRWARYCAFTDEDVKDAADFLHDIGSIIRFSDAEAKLSGLDDIVITNKQWLADVMRRLITARSRGFKLTRVDIGQLWSDYPPDVHRNLLDLLIKFDLVIEVNSENFLIPCLLPDVTPSKDAIDEFLFAANGRKSLSLRTFVFFFSPYGFFNLLQVRLREYDASKVLSCPGLMWRNGMAIASSEETRGILVLQADQNKLECKFCGQGKENLISIVSESVHLLLSERYDVDYDVFVPCDGCLEFSTGKPHMFSTNQTIKKALESRQTFLQCHKDFHNIPVSNYCTNPLVSNRISRVQIGAILESIALSKAASRAHVYLSFCPEDGALVEGIRSRIQEHFGKNAIRTWIPQYQTSRQVNMNEMALSSASVIIGLITEGYCERDGSGMKELSFALRIKSKPVIPCVVSDDGTEREPSWTRSAVGLLLAGQLYIDMRGNDAELKLQELFERTQVLLSASGLGSSSGRRLYDFMISYSWSNCNKSFSCPRTIKKAVEAAGAGGGHLRGWLDIEQLGNRPNESIFEGIRRGVMESDVVVLCLSDEYSLSKNCAMECRFSILNRRNVVIALVGTEENINVPAAWKSSETGLLTSHLWSTDADDKEQSLVVDFRKVKDQVEFDEKVALLTRTIAHLRRERQVEDENERERSDLIDVSKTLEQKLEYGRRMAVQFLRSHSQFGSDFPVLWAVQWRSETAQQGSSYDDWSHNDYYLYVISESPDGWALARNAKWRLTNAQQSIRAMSPVLHMVNKFLHVLQQGVLCSLSKKEVEETTGQEAVQDKFLDYQGFEEYIAACSKSQMSTLESTQQSYQLIENIVQTSDKDSFSSARLEQKVFPNKEVFWVLNQSEAVLDAVDADWLVRSTATHVQEPGVSAMQDRDSNVARSLGNPSNNVPWSSIRHPSIGAASAGAVGEHDTVQRLKNILARQQELLRRLPAK